MKGKSVKTIHAIIAILMFVGGHYTYSKVPLFNWLKDTFDFKRNHYDLWTFFKRHVRYRN